MDSIERTTPLRSVSRSELIWLAGALIFGSLLRLAFPGRIAIEHFDEGVYASNFWFGPENGFSYPARYLYAPPLLPAAIEWTMVLASMCGMRPTGWIPFLPSLVAGIAMIPSMWWISRRWFGAGAGIVSAWLVACSDFHSSYSRAALTDVPVCLFLLWGVYFTGIALQRCQILTAAQSNLRGRKPPATNQRFPLAEIVLAALFTGLAWWTKYNGWLPIAIGVAGGTLWQILLPVTQRQLIRSGFCVLLISCLAGVVWLPVLWGLQTHGGYSTVAANHRQYLVGWRGWIRSAYSQMDAVRLYEDPFSALRLDGKMPEGPHRGTEHPREEADVPSGQEPQRTTTNDPKGAPGSLVAVAAFPLSLLFIGVAACIVALRSRSTRMSVLPVCLVLSWLVGLSVTTPLYTPYPRLILPWLCSIWICMGLACEIWWSRRSPVHVTVRHRGVWVVVLLLVAVSVLRHANGASFVWEDRTGVQRVSAEYAVAAGEVAVRAGFREEDVIIYVLGEPAMVFGLKGEGIAAVGPVQNLEFAGSRAMRPTFVAYSSRTSALPEGMRLELESGRFELTRQSTVEPSHLVVLDERSGNSGAPRVRELTYYLARQKR